MMMTRRAEGNPPPGHNTLLFFDMWHGIFYMPSRIDMAGHTKAFDYPVMDHWMEFKLDDRIDIG